MLELRLEAPSRAAGPIVFDLSQGEEAIAALAKAPVSIKEGAECVEPVSSNAEELTADQVLVRVQRAPKEPAC
jgi:hypothetical protein